jgi:hypothetical protein
MINRPVQHFLRREANAVRERDRVMMPEALPEPDPAVIDLIAQFDQKQRERLEHRRQEQVTRHRRPSEPFNPIIIQNNKWPRGPLDYHARLDQEQREPLERRRRGRLPARCWPIEPSNLVIEIQDCAGPIF